MNKKTNAKKASAKKAPAKKVVKEEVKPTKVETKAKEEVNKTEASEVKTGTIGKSALISMVANKTELSKDNVSKVINALLETATEVLAEGKSINITGFGSLNSIYKPEQTRITFGKEITIPAHRSVKFKAGKTLRDTLSKKE